MCQASWRDPCAPAAPRASRARPDLGAHDSGRLDPEHLEVKQFETAGGNSANYCKISPYCQGWTAKNYWACSTSDALSIYDVDSSWTDGNPSARSCPCK